MEGKRQSRIQQTFVDISIKLFVYVWYWIDDMVTEEYGQEKCWNYIYENKITLRRININAIKLKVKNIWRKYNQLKIKEKYIQSKFT